MNLSDRMRQYESVADFELMSRSPMLVRVDGRAFHSLTKRFFSKPRQMEEFSGKPFDSTFMNLMCQTMLALAAECQGSVFGYTQSDEISIVLLDNQSRTSQPYFGKRVQKIASITAAVATMVFNRVTREEFGLPTQAMFDSRCFVVPDDEEVVNCLLWRQQDATRNSIQSWCLYKLAEKIGFKTAMKALHGKDTDKQQDILFVETGINWNDLPVRWKRGVACYKVPTKIVTPQGEAVRPKWELDWNCPIFSQDKGYIARHLQKNEQNGGMS